MSSETDSNQSDKYIYLKNSPISVFHTDEVSWKEVETKKGKEFHVTGYISTHDKDLVNDIVTKSGMTDMFNQLVSRNIKIDFEHEAFKGDNNTDMEINKTKIPLGRIIKAFQDEKGIFVEAVLNKAHEKYEKVVSSIKGGFLDAFSIAYIPIRAVNKKIKDEFIRLLDKVNLLNVALTGNPANTKSKIRDVFTKSIDNLEKQNEVDIMNGNDKQKETKEKSQDKKEVQAKEAKEKEAQKKSEKSEFEKLSEQLKSMSERLEKLEAQKKEDSEESGEDSGNDDGKQEGVEAKDKRIEEAETQIKTLKADLKKVLEQPQYKSHEENMKSVLEGSQATQTKSAGPLDLV